MSSNVMKKITTSYPTAYYVENDTIKILITDQFSSPFVLECVIANINNK